MNEQPDQFYSQILMFVFVGIGIYSYLFSKKPQRSNLDFFEIGYVMHDDVPVYEMVNSQTVQRKRKEVSTKSTYAPKPKATPKPKAAPKQQLTQFQKDCIDVLVKLGYKKRDATKRMHDFFAKYQPKTIPEFLQVVFKHEHS